MSASAPSRLGARQVYGLHATLGIAGLAATVAVVCAAATSVHIAPHSGHRLVIASQAVTYPAVNVAAGILLALAALGAGIIIVALRAGWRQVRATRAFLRDLHVIGPLASHPTVHVIDDASPQAFCAGYVRPRVYVSTGALALLSKSELRAVLAHEYHHRDMRDPLRLAWGGVLSEALFFMPVMRRLHDRYRDLAELTADAAALRATNGATAPLASALLTLGTQDSENVVGISPERVDSLLGLPRSWRLPSLLVVAALATIATIVVLAWRTSQAASAQTTFNLPIVASQPCILVLGLVPMLACAAAITTRRHAARSPRQRVTKNL